MRQPIFQLAFGFIAFTVTLQLPVLLAAGNVTISPNPNKEIIMLAGESKTITCTSDNSQGTGHFVVHPNRARIHYLPPFFVA